MPQPKPNQTLTIIRGLPGSGKSTLAQTIKGQVPNTLHFEADMYFMHDGEYEFDMLQLYAAHEWCMNGVEGNLEAGWNVVVSNTFTTNREMLPYFRIADHLNIPVQVLECHGSFGSIHNVPQESINRMRDRWETVDMSKTCSC